MYDEINEKIERISKKLHFAMIKVSYSGTILSPLLTTLANYFINDLGTDSYQDLTLV